MASKTIKLKAKAENGEVTVKALIKHPMETGRRKDKDTGELVPAHFINEVTCTHKGEPVLETVFLLQTELGPDATPAEKEVARLRKQAEGMEKMLQKSEAEQQSFREEADDLEAELGF